MSLLPDLDNRPPDGWPAEGFSSHPNAPGSDERGIPANVEAEQAVLGALLYENGAFPDVGDFLKPEHFYEPFHGRLYEAIEAHVRAGRLADPIVLAEQFAGDPAFQELAGVRYLADLIDRAPPAANAADYARAVFDLAVRRKVMATCAAGLKAAAEETTLAAFEVVSQVREGLEQIEHEAAPEDVSMVSAEVAADHAIAAMEERARSGRPRGKMTGLRCIDRRIGGLLPGAMLVIGGRPSMGKTALGRNILHGAAVLNPDDDFAYLGIEMGPEEMSQRQLSALTFAYADGVAYQAMSTGALTPFDLQNIRIARGHVPPNLTLDDCPALSLEDVRRKVWSLQRKSRRRGRRFAALVIDYLQLMKRPAAHGRNDATVLGEITAGLKQIARTAGICIVLLSQLNRAVEARDEKKPELRDLRESGNIEQDADAVLFTYREFYYVERKEPKKSHTQEHLDWEMKCADLRTRLDVICAKQRQGPVGSDRQVYHAEFDLIEDCHEQA